MDKLQKLVKSSLLEINKLKMEIVQLKEEQNSLRSSDEFEDLKSESEKLLNEKDAEIIDLKNKHVEEVSNLKIKHQEDLTAKENEISDLKTRFDDDLKSKSLELSDFLAKFDNDMKVKDDEIADIKAKYQADLNTKNYEIENLTHSLNTNIEVLNRSKDLLNSKDETIRNLSDKVNELTDLNESLSKMKESFDEEFNSFKTLELGQANLKLKEALNEVSFKDNEIQAISNDLKIANNKNSDLQRQVNEAKNKENQANLKLANTLTTLDEKNMEIQSLNSQIASQNEEILDLKNNLVNKDNLVALQRELDSRDVAIRERDVQISLLKDKSVSREEYAKLQTELSKKDLQIQRLNEVKDLFFELSDNTFLDDQAHDGIMSKTSAGDRELMELNDIKKELELAKENNLKIRAVEEQDLEKIANLIDSTESQSSDLNLEDSLNELNQSNAEEVAKLKQELEEYKSSVAELEKFKFVYEKLTAPQLNNLNSIQSQIYHLLPEDEAMDTLSVKEYLNDLAFKNLSFGNTKNILKSLERKGYVEVAKKENDVFFWQKLPLPDES
jgi:chromosome segregation ATPase